MVIRPDCPYNYMVIPNDVIPASSVISRKAWSVTSSRKNNENSAYENENLCYSFFPPVCCNWGVYYKILFNIY